MEVDFQADDEDMAMAEVTKPMVELKTMSEVTLDGEALGGDVEQESAGTTKTATRTGTSSRYP